MDLDRLISPRAKSLDASGIRRVFELGATMNDPINLSIGQPDFPVPASVKDAAIAAIREDRNGYSMTGGIPELRDRCASWIASDLGWPDASTDAGRSELGVAVTSGTSGALFLMNLALLGPGAEIIIPDPYFVAYPHMATFAGGRAVRCDTYPDFRMTAERVEPLITPATKAVLLNSPANPSGVVMTQAECRELLELCRAKGVLLISDEIYDEFCFDDAREDFANGRKCPSPCREPGSHEDTLLIRGFGKTYGCTGWRMGYIAGPPRLVQEIAKLQQYSFVCAPTPLQWGCMATFEADMSGPLGDYATRRDLVIEKLGQYTEVARPGGAFYSFIKVPERLGMTGKQFFEAAVEKNVLIIPGGVFSERDTHFRLSFATAKPRLIEGLDRLAELMAG